MPHLYARQPREQLAQHVAEGELVVVERALPVGLDHDQPGEPRPRQDALAVQRARRLPLLEPFAVERVAGRIEVEHAAAGEIAGLELEREPRAVDLAFDARGRVVLRKADDAPRRLLHEAQPAEMGVPQTVMAAPALPGQRTIVAFREILAGEVAVAAQLEAAGAALLRLGVAEGEFVRRGAAFDRVFRHLAPVGAAHAAAVLGEDHGPE